MSDPRRHLRALHAERADAFARLPSNPPESTPSFLGKVVDGGSMPTTGGKFFLLEPVDADGTESEGGAATLSADSSRKIPTLVLGDDPPGAGDFLVARAIGGLWVADRGCSGAGGGCAVTFKAIGCNTAALGSATGTTSVSVWDTSAKGTLCDSGVADSTGTISLSLLPYRSPPLTYYYEAAHSSGRFGALSGTFTCNPSPINLPFGNSVSAGYACSPIGGCALPWPTTLYYSDSLIGAVTLTYAGGAANEWTGFGSFAYAGCGSPAPPCPPVTTVPVQITISNTLQTIQFGFGRAAIFPTSRLCPNGGASKIGPQAFFAGTTPTAFVTCLTFIGTGAFTLSPLPGNYPACLPGVSFVFTE